MLVTDIEGCKDIIRDTSKVYIHLCTEIHALKRSSLLLLKLKSDIFSAQLQRKQKIKYASRLSLPSTHSGSKKLRCKLSPHKHISMECSMLSKFKTVSHIVAHELASLF